MGSLTTEPQFIKDLDMITEIKLGSYMEKLLMLSEDAINTNDYSEIQKQNKAFELELIKCKSYVLKKYADGILTTR